MYSCLYRLKVSRMASSRFMNFSLVKRTDELMKPSEIQLQQSFMNSDNIRLVHLTSMERVSPTLAFREVVDAMRVVFRISISSSDLPTVDYMNESVLLKLQSEYRRSRDMQRRQKDMAFTNSGIPGSFLPRPSMSLDSRDKTVDHVIEFRR